MKTVITKVQTRSGVAEFANAAEGAAYARKHGGFIIGANSTTDIGSSPSMPVRNPGTCTLLGLSTAAMNTSGEMECAWQANGRTTPRDRDKIISALVKFWKVQIAGSTDAEVTAMLTKRHPLLFPTSPLNSSDTTANEQRLAGNEVLLLATGPTLAFHN